MNKCCILKILVLCVIRRTKAETESFNSPVGAVPINDEITVPVLQTLSRGLLDGRDSISESESNFPMRKVRAIKENAGLVAHRFFNRATPSKRESRKASANLKGRGKNNAGKDDSDNGT